MCLLGDESSVCVWLFYKSGMLVEHEIASLLLSFERADTKSHFAAKFFVHASYPLSYQHSLLNLFSSISLHGRARILCFVVFSVVKRQSREPFGGSVIELLSLSLVNLRPGSVNRDGM